MITEREVREAIDECMKEPITGAKRSALADLIIIEDYLFGTSRTEPVVYDEPPAHQYSGSQSDEIVTDGGSEFLDAINGRRADKAWLIIDELVEAVKVLHPRMHQSFMDKLYDI